MKKMFSVPSSSLGVLMAAAFADIMPVFQQPRMRADYAPRLSRTRPYGNPGHKPHQGKREIERRRRQIENMQLDFAASGQPEIAGYRRFVRDLANGNVQPTE